MAFEGLGVTGSIFPNWPTWLLSLVLIWTLIWKGLALWKSAMRKSKPWFVILLIVNTLGILEIFYIFVFSEMGRKKGNSKKR